MGSLRGLSDWTKPEGPLSPSATARSSEKQALMSELKIDLIAWLLQDQDEGQIIRGGPLGPAPYETDGAGKPEAQEG